MNEVDSSSWDQTCSLAKAESGRRLATSNKSSAIVASLWDQGGKILFISATMARNERMERAVEKKKEVTEGLLTG
ncbi:hypothetical protein ALC53_02603 [Atta colombica]|uniref:Uncharacterized protein n=1 Tax=Atta colombica TaxID=520822 RepID=A0A195BQG8_9HYME|nr:hypothetical protein ALC53_02603 [Atta colombica]